MADLNIETKVDDEAAQKKKAKKERKKLKQQEEPKDSSKEDTPAPNEVPAENDEETQVTKKGKKAAKDDGKNFECLRNTFNIIFLCLCQK